MNTTTAPMLGSTRSGDAPGESSWDRQDFIDGTHRRSRGNRAWKPVARRGLRRREAALVAWDVADMLDDGDTLPTRADIAARNELAVDVDWWELDREFDDTDDLLGWTPEAMRDAAEVQAILDEAGVTTLAELAALVAAEVAAKFEVDDDDLPGWGETFDPADVQWGFTVRTRP